MYKPNFINWRYRNTALLALSVIILILFADHAIVRGIISSIAGLGLLGVFFAGMFYVSTFTIVPATILLAALANNYGFWETTLVATLGSIVGDYLIFRFIKDTVIEEISPLLETIAKEKHIYTLFHSPLFAWLLPVLGAAVIASPFPDELGLSILGISKMGNKKFLLLVSVLDFVGIALLVSVLRTFDA